MACLDDFPCITVGDATVFHGSNLDVLPFMADNSVDSIVCDPPYELGFMGKKWDSSGIAYSVELWAECLRVLKPGGHLLAFGSSRTWHRIAVAIEDSGFQVRDSIAWLYGSGFPKSLDISKAIDKAAGAEREVIATNKRHIGSTNWQAEDGGRWDPRQADDKGYKSFDITTSATAEAQQWEGWGTALKPAFEPIVVARKPLIGTVAENVLAWGVGGLNIDASRIGTESVGWAGAGSSGETATAGASQGGEQGGYNYGDGEPRPVQGRWPANIILDEYTAGLLDEQSGISTSLSHNRPHSTKWGFGVNADNAKDYDYNTGGGGYGDTGGASRFFYVAKASKRDRNEGLDELPAVQSSKFAQDKWSKENMNFDTAPRQNFHPTVKPTDLMRYLIKLVTPAGGIVLDPFTGSGSTGKAALLDGYRFIGIELTEDYLPIIEGRLRWADQEHRDQVEASEAEAKETLF
jgi:DNA modification methylase